VRDEEGSKEHLRKPAQTRRCRLFRGRIEFLQPRRHRVSVDLVVFVSALRGIRRRSRVVDLGAGFGFLSLVIAKKFGCRVYAVERDPQMLALLRENVRINNLTGLITPVDADLRHVEGAFQKGEFDAVVANPPFFPEGYRGADSWHFETDTTLRDFVSASSHLLRDGGYFNVLIPSFRLYELFILLRDFNLPPRFLTPIYSKPDKPAKLVTVVSVRNVPGPLHWTKALFINTPEGGYTQTRS